jgi:gliding motility-associated-like protein
MPDTVVVPNVFTPNGDNQNDLFVIRNVETWSNGSLQVFNRWGALVYETNDVVNTIWDGTDMNSGTVLADGVYFYMLTVGDADTGWKDSKQGTVTIFSGGL